MIRFFVLLELTEPADTENRSFLSRCKNMKQAILNVFSKNRDLKFFLKYALIVTTAFYQNGKPNDIALNKRRIYSHMYSGEK